MANSKKKTVSKKKSQQKKSQQKKSQQKKSQQKNTVESNGRSRVLITSRSIIKNNKNNPKNNSGNNKNNNQLNNIAMSLKNLKNQIKENGKINASNIKFIEFGLEDLKDAITQPAVESACNRIGGEMVNDICRVNVQKTIEKVKKTMDDMVTIIEVSKPHDKKAHLAQKNFMKKFLSQLRKQSKMRMVGGGPVGCQSTHCPHNTRLVYGAEGTINCDAPKWRGGQEMHYLLGAKY